MVVKFPPPPPKAITTRSLQNTFCTDLTLLHGNKWILFPRAWGSRCAVCPKGGKDSERRLWVTARTFELGQGWNSGNYAV